MNRNHPAAGLPERLGISLALLFLLPGLSFAEGIAGKYALKGVHSKKGAFTSTITIASQDGKLTVTRVVANAAGPDEIGKGTAAVAKTQRHDLRLGEELRVALAGPAGNHSGMSAALTGNSGAAATAKQPVLVFRLSDPAQQRCHAVVTYPDGTRSEAWGRKVDAKDATDSGALMVFTKGGLKRALKSELKKALRKGVKLDETLKLHDFLHVGLGGKIRVLTEEDLSPFQVKSLHQKGKGVWLATTAEGGIRLPFTASIPLGSAGTASVGFVPGVEIAYEVVDLYDRPDGVKDVKTIGKTFWKAGKRAFKLPLDAAKAEALTVGATRTLEGQLTVAISGSLGIGWDTSEVNDIVEIGASARVGGFYRIRRPLRMELTRLDRKQVVLHLTKAKERSFGVEARLFAGASLNEDELTDDISVEYVEPVVELAADGLDQVVKSVLRFELKGELSRTDKDEFEVAYQFDLTQKEARKAYDRAVRGDLTRAAFAARTPQKTGVLLKFRIFDLERRVVAKADLHLSELVDGKLRKISSDKLLDIEDTSGKTKYHVFRFNRQRSLGLFAFWKKIRKKWDERLFIEVIRATDVTGLSPEEIKFLPWRMAQRTFRFRYTIRDPHTRKSEGDRLRRVLKAWGLDGAESLPRPKRRLFRSRYGRTNTSLTVDISERGIRQVMAITTKNRPELEAHFKRAYKVVHEKEPKAKLVRKFFENMHGLAKAAPGRSRGEFLNALAESSGWDLTLITALVNMSPTGVRIHASIDGKRISFANGKEGKYFAEFNPNLYGH